MKIAIGKMTEGQKFKFENGKVSTFHGLRHSFPGRACYFVGDGVLECSPRKLFEVTEQDKTK